jgi:hypothetical protein
MANVWLAIQSCCLNYYKAQMHLEDFVPPFLKKEMYLKSYRPVFNPIPAQHG